MRRVAIVCGSKTTYLRTRMFLIWDQSSKKMEKQTVGLVHGLLSLSLLSESMFYLSLKGGIKTAVFRQFYKDEQLVDRDPFLAIKDNFMWLLEERWQQRRYRIKKQREQVQKDRQIFLAAKKQKAEERLCD
ncbi:unnamed protein product [Eruca vesicaria subsp. sativa]|uniref:PORR domain-containing protein n=1 Tax=Eruca vesicaria subsp. sativa TaxID=29727 RepID=A0ABC8JY60_ERUVS|nr:unnamed protein product [Eruca vesicaria subsp. sativa]